MIEPETPANEQVRLDSLQSLDILDSPAEERFDRLTRLAKRIFDVPIALVSIVDQNRQWFKSCVGLDVSETPRDISFCGHAILGNEVFVVTDTAEDPRFDDNPLVVNDPFIRFYAGCPLKYTDGSMLGTLCIIDTRPR
jgi:GAF domain-containing protein